MPTVLPFCSCSLSLSLSLSTEALDHLIECKALDGRSDFERYTHVLKNSRRLPRVGHFPLIDAADKVTRKATEITVNNTKQTSLSEDTVSVSLLSPPQALQALEQNWFGCLYAQMRLCDPLKKTDFEKTQTFSFNFQWQRRFEKTSNFCCDHFYSL